MEARATGEPCFDSRAKTIISKRQKRDLKKVVEPSHFIPRSGRQSKLCFRRMILDS
jgi:hypothetical protein